MKIKKFIIIFFIFLFYVNLYSAKITVKIFDDSRISFDLLSSDNVDMGNLIANQFYLSSSDSGRIILKNTGEVPIGFSLSIQMQSSGVIPVEGTPGENKFRLFGLFHKWDVNPEKDDFKDDDIITTKYKDASTNVFCKLNYSDKYKGINIEPETEQSLFLRIDAPSLVTEEPSVLNFKLLIKAFMTIQQEEPHKKPEEKIFTPNGDGINDLLIFHGLSGKLQQGGFEIKIIDVRGRLIRLITDVEYWDGKDEEGKYVKTGAYLYQYKYDNNFITGIAIIAR